jgi:hypothetical protein
MGISRPDISSGSLSVDQPLYRVLGVLLCKAGASHCHLDRFVTHQFKIEKSQKTEATLWLLAGFVRISCTKR